MTKIINQKPFQTYDLGISAALITLGYRLLDLDKSNPRKVQFHFIFEESIEEVVNSYWSDNLEVNPRTYFDNIKMLKNRLYTD